MTAAQRSERAFLPLQRDHRLFQLTHNSPGLRNFYDLMSVSTPCSDKSECCKKRDQYLGHRARKFVNPECVNQLCDWYITSYTQIDRCRLGQI